MSDSTATPNPHWYQSPVRVHRYIIHRKWYVALGFIIAGATGLTPVILSKSWDETVAKISIYLLTSLFFGSWILPKTWPGRNSRLELRGTFLTSYFDDSVTGHEDLRELKTIRPVSSRRGKRILYHEVAFNNGNLIMIRPNLEGYEELLALLKSYLPHELKHQPGKP